MCYNEKLIVNVLCAGVLSETCDMAFINCKMCGGTMENTKGLSVGVCSHCGTLQTLPRLGNERIATLYECADRMRRNGEFDKAAAVYEKVLAEERTDAEAYWSLVLCSYGIKYVEDLKTGSRVPSINRAQSRPVSEDENFKSALKYADEYQRELYENEAEVIGGLQKSIAGVTLQDAAFDVFISCKEDDKNWRRTQDSVIANDLYNQLTHEGVKVFYARITLENRSAEEHEAYRFAALNTAKVMVVIGTEKDYFKAPQVRNDWSRYLLFVGSSGGRKTVIPAFKGMHRSCLPEEFAGFYAQDVSKPGFMQELIRGINKLVGYYEAKPLAEGTAGVNANVTAHLNRAHQFLEEGNWYKADEFFELALNEDPENVDAYLGKLMAFAHARRREDFYNCPEPFDTNENYRIVEKLGGEELVAELRGYIDYINERNKNEYLAGIYNKAVSAMNVAMTDQTYISAAELFKKVPGFQDADELAEKCLEKAEAYRKNTIYTTAMMQMQQNGLRGYQEALESFEKIRGWRDVEHQISICRRSIDEINEMIEADRQERKKKKKSKRRKVLAIVFGVLAVVAAAIVILVLTIN